VSLTTTLKYQAKARLGRIIGLRSKVLLLQGGWGLRQLYFVLEGIPAVLLASTHFLLDLVGEGSLLYEVGLSKFLFVVCCS
jgi:hypothetical protein